MYRIKLLSKPNGLNYSNVIHKPASETLYPVEVTDFLSDLQGYTNNITKTKWEEITTGLVNVPELIDVQAKNTEIDESLFPIVAKDPGMQLIVNELKRLRELLSNIKKDNYEDAGENNE
jgi:hypothetical protein